MKIYLKFTFETKLKMILESKSGTLILKILMNVMGHHTGPKLGKAYLVHKKSRIVLPYSKGFRGTICASI